MKFEFNLHPKQLEVFNCDKRFKVVVAGRRAGKSYLARILLLVEALKNETEDGRSLQNSVVMYIAPTFDQARRIMWNELKFLCKDVISSTLENQGILKLINGREIHLRGADRPDTIRGVSISFVVMDEYAFMKPEVWDYIVRPALADVRGKALFIGTPEGKNHFYELYQFAKRQEIKEENGKGKSEWATFQFTSIDNPTIPIKEEIKRAIEEGASAEVIRQEFFASFFASGGRVLKPDQLVEVDEEPQGGTWYIAVDPAGYADIQGKITGTKARLDETAIACVKVGQYGWYIGEIISGRWGIQETSFRILQAVQKYQCSIVGIEKGSLKNAVEPYLTDQMRKYRVFFRIRDVTHGGKKKSDRIAWALQGRMEHGKILVPSANSDVEDLRWKHKLVNQMIDFPNPLAHDDMLDALAYIDQLVSVVYDDYEQQDFDEWHETGLGFGWEPLDEVAGY